MGQHVAIMVCFCLFLCFRLVSWLRYCCYALGICATLLLITYTAVTWRRTCTGESATISTLSMHTSTCTPALMPDCHQVHTCTHSTQQSRDDSPAQVSQQQRQPALSACTPVPAHLHSLYTAVTWRLTCTGKLATISTLSMHTSTCTPPRTPDCHQVHTCTHSTQPSRDDSPVSGVSSSNNQQAGSTRGTHTSTADQLHNWQLHLYTTHGSCCCILAKCQQSWHKSTISFRLTGLLFRSYFTLRIGIIGAAFHRADAVPVSQLQCQVLKGIEALMP